MKQGTFEAHHGGDAGRRGPGRAGNVQAGGLEGCARLDQPGRSAHQSPLSSIRAYPAERSTYMDSFLSMAAWMSAGGVSR